MRDPAATASPLVLLLLAAGAWGLCAPVGQAQDAPVEAELLDRIEAELRPAEAPLRPFPHWSAPGRPRLALALSGGGARGFAHVGILAALEEEGIEIDGLAGTSAGALAGAFFAAGYAAAEIEEMFELGDWNELFLGLDVRRRSLSRDEDLARNSTQLRLRRRRAPASSRPPGLLGTDSLDRALQSVLLLAQSASGGDFDRLAVPFRPVATDLVTGRKVAPSSGPLATLVRGSAAVPGLMTPVPLGEALLIDGGLRENVPVETALEFQAHLVIAVDVSQRLGEASELRSPIDVVDRTLDIVMEAKTQQSLALASLVLRPEVETASRTASGPGIKPLVAAGRRLVEDGRREIWRSLEAAAPDARTLHVDSLEVLGTERVSASFLRERLDLAGSGELARWRVAAELARLLNRMPFESGHVELRRTSGGSLLRFVLHERRAPASLRIEGLDAETQPLEEASLLALRRAAWTLRLARIEKGDVLTHLAGFAWSGADPTLRWAQPRVVELSTEATVDPKLQWTKRRVSNLDGERFAYRRLAWRLDDLKARGVIRSWRLRPEPREHAAIALIAELEPDRTDELAMGASYRSDLHWAGVLRLRRGNLSGRGDDIALTAIGAKERTGVDLRYGNPGGLGLRTAGFELGAGWQRGFVPLAGKDQEYDDLRADEYEARSAWLQLVHRASLGSQLKVGFLYEHRRFPPEGSAASETEERTAASLRWTLDRQDRLLFPTSGGRLLLRTDLNLIGDELWRLEARGDWAIGLDARSLFVLAPRAAFGLSDDADHRSFWFDPGGHRSLYGYVPYGAAAPQYAQAGVVLRHEFFSRGPVDFYCELGLDMLWTSLEGSGIDQLEDSHGFGLSLTANVHRIGPITIGWAANSDDATVWFFTAGFPFLQD